MRRRSVDRSFHTDGIGTIAHHIRGAAYAGAATARGHYNHQRERLDHVRGLTRRFGQWRESTTATDDSDDDTDNDSPGAATPDTLGAQAGAETAAVTGAETAAAVAAPEAVIPAVAAAAAAKHIEHQYHPSKLANQVSAAQAPRPTPPDSPAAPRQELGQDTVASRAAPSLRATDKAIARGAVVSGSDRRRAALRISDQSAQTAAPRPWRATDHTVGTAPGTCDHLTSSLFNGVRTRLRVTSFRS
jgi:hypothetical protein